MEVSKPASSNVSTDPPGIPNLGKTCYINATLQCLLSIHPLVDWLLKTNASQTPSDINAFDPLLTPVLANLVSAMYRGNFHKELLHFREVIGQLNKEFKDPREQDAQEFLLFILNLLHDENVESSQEAGSKEGTSEVRRILSGVSQTVLECPICYPYAEKRKKSLGSSSHILPNVNQQTKDKSEVFLSLSLPIPVDPDRFGETLYGPDVGNGGTLKLVVNEIYEGQQPLCHQRLLSLKLNTDIGGAYATLASMPSVKRTTQSDNVTGAFLLVQARSNGFGDWFLERSGKVSQLVDDLNMEDDFRSKTPNVMKIKRNLLVEDGLYMFHLDNKPTDIYPYSGQQETIDPTCTTCLLLVHVTEPDKRPLPLVSDADADSVRSASFQRFSLPLALVVSNAVDFENLCYLALQSLLSFCGDERSSEKIMRSPEYRGVTFWVVDCAPGEPREIDSSQEFPLLSPTVELSSMSLPDWLAPFAGASAYPRLLRLLVVWPRQQPVDLLETFRLSLDDSILKPAGATAPSATGGVGNSQGGASRPKSHSSSAPMDVDTEADSELSIVKCLKAFVETGEVIDAGSFQCPKCRMMQETGFLRTRLLTAPNYLLLHLNRFVQAPASLSNPDQTGLLKIKALVNYPIEGLDLSFMLDSDSRKSIELTSGQSTNANGEPIYDLVAVCSHKGSIETGHITAYCKNLFTGQWLHYNDLKVTKVPSDYAIQSDAYVLFYKKRGAFAATAPLQSNIVDLAQSQTNAQFATKHCHYDSEVETNTKVLGTNSESGSNSENLIGQLPTDVAENTQKNPLGSANTTQSTPDPIQTTATTYGRSKSSRRQSGTRNTTEDSLATQDNPLITRETTHGPSGGTRGNGNTSSRY